MAGGSGTRMGDKIPKQFIEILGKPIIAYTYSQFKSIKDLNTIIVLPEKKFQFWKDYLSKIIQEENYNEIKDKRFISVKNGLKKIDDDDGIVAIHDGVRPMLSKNHIMGYVNNRENEYNGDRSEEDIINSLRKKLTSISGDSGIKTAETPQIFKIKIINDSFKKATQLDYTDEATLIEETGQKINLIKGEQQNIKLTENADLEYFKKINF